MLLSFSKNDINKNKFSRKYTSFHQQSFKEIAKGYINSNPFMYELGYEEDFSNYLSPYTDFDSINKFNI